MWFDAELSFSEHVQNNCKATFLQMQDLHRIREYLTPEVTILATTALVTSCLDYSYSRRFVRSQSTQIAEYSEYLLLVLSQIIESLVMLHPFLRKLTDCLLSTSVCPQL